MVPLTYRFFTDVIPKNNIKRSLDPYRVSYRSNRMSTNTKRHFSTTRPKASAIPHISLHIAAASSGKGRKYEADKSTVDYIPDGSNAIGLQGSGNLYAKRRNRTDSGEDAYFAATVGDDQTTIALGVCDGVGGWAEQGINSADFSHGLCDYMADHALKHQPHHNLEPNQQLHPKTLMHVGYDGTLKDTQIRAGGATACVAIADGTGRIRTANLGDSGFVHIRQGSVHSYSTPQTHAFNTPFQMSKIPHEIMTQASIFGGLPLSDAPDRADIADTQLQHGDIVIFATDGVWDNLSSQDILTIVSQQMRELKAWERTDKGTVVNPVIAGLTQPKSSLTKDGRSLQSCLASHIVREAKNASVDRKRDGPFAKAVQREYPMDRFHGGKVDDITVLVLVAVENKRGEEPELKAKL